MVVKKGVFVVVDGLDGIGKGVIERALVEYEQKLGRTTFDAISWSRAHKKCLPELSDFWSLPTVYYNTVVIAEPTYAGIGDIIRNEMIRRDVGRAYLAEELIQAYSLDRLVQMRRVVVPALENGLSVIQSRCVASTLCYQSLSAMDEGVDPEKVRRKILEHSGNRYQLKHRPDLLIIPVIGDVKVLVERIVARGVSEKDDKAIFEVAEFQERLKSLYESEWLRKLFEKVGTRVAYLDAGISPESSRKQAVDIYRYFLESGEVLEGHRAPDFG